MKDGRKLETSFVGCETKIAVSRAFGDGKFMGCLYSDEKSYEQRKVQRSASRFLQMSIVITF